jgi:hypothetical protein
VRVLLVLLTACGRIGFDPMADGGAVVTLADLACVDNNSGTSITIPRTPGASGNVGIVAYEGAVESTVVTISDDAGSTWIRYAATSGDAGLVYYAAPIAPGATTITLAIASVSACACYYEAVGVDLAAPTDTAAALPAGTSVVAKVATGATVTIAQPSELIVSVANVSSGVDGIAAGSLFTNDALLHSDGHAHLITTSAGTYTPAWSDSTGTYSSYTAAFKPR